MTAPDPATIYAACYNRLKSDSAGATVRTALGGAANSVIPVWWLNRTYPTSPFMAFAGMAVTPTDGDAFDLKIGWYIIDDLIKAFYRIDRLVPLIQAAYLHDFVTNGYVSGAQSPEEKPDMPIRMNVRPLFFTVSIRQ